MFYIDVIYLPIRVIYMFKYPKLFVKSPGLPTAMSPGDCVHVHSRLYELFSLLSACVYYIYYNISVCKFNGPPRAGAGARPKLNPESHTK